MINLLIVNNDPNICKGLINGTAIYVKNIRPCGISYTAKEAFEIIKKQKIDLAIIDYDIDQSGVEKILEYIDKNKE